RDTYLTVPNRNTRKLSSSSSSRFLSRERPNANLSSDMHNLRPGGFVRADGACAIQRFCLTLPHKHNLISFFPNLSVQRPESVIFQIWPPATLGDYDQI